MLDHLRILNSRHDRDSRDQVGASAVEYGLLIAGIAALIAAIVFVFGGAVQNLFTGSCGKFSAGASATSASTC